MIDDTNFFLTNPSSVVSMTGAEITTNNISMSIFESEQPSCGIKPTKTQRQQDETTKLDDNRNPTNTIANLCHDSYQTPRRKPMDYCTLSLDPPPAPRKMKYFNDDAEILKTIQQTISSIHIPSISLSSPSRASSPSFQLLSRAECTYDSSQCFKPNMPLPDIPDCILFRQKTRTSESKMNSSTFQSRMIRCKLEPQFENLHVTTAQTFERVKRRNSV
eukprot:CAMPEP_0198258208 /NCGR_PEP_ID=MMETSP1447-20131203/7705_1 /TAXON_ID=420782 /ORGANISM="Chaetoceros dichaeta, Strain CCMP1751" /LENGTH=217 /DNA_ID=CAMNT_0043945281 /DNA_START=28 /DNA_END=678 /DNA_ORIENTATION=+